MMFGYGGGWPGWEIALMWIVMIAFTGLLAWGACAVAGGASRRRSGPAEGVADPGRILDEWLARGEIDADEHARLRAALASGRPRRPAGARSRN